MSMYNIPESVYRLIEDMESVPYSDKETIYYTLEKEWMGKIDELNDGLEDVKYERDEAQS